MSDGYSSCVNAVVVGGVRGLAAEMGLSGKVVLKVIFV